MRFMNQLRNKNNLPIVLLFIVVLNYLPVFLKNGFTKEALSVSVVMMAICFILEILLLLYVYFQNIEKFKNSKKKIIILAFVIVILCIAQVKNLVEHNFYWMDLFNIGCIAVNIALLYIAVDDFQIDEKKVYLFFKGIFWIAIVAIIWNLILFHEEILSEFGIVKLEKSNLYIYNVKGFFSNRNSLAFFLYIAIISNTFMMLSEKQKKFYKISFFILLFGIWCTHSKTGYLIAILFLGMFAFLNDQYTIKKRILVCSLIAIIGLVGFLDIIGMKLIPHFIQNPIEETENKGQNENSNTPVITLESAKTLTSRTLIWKKGLERLNESPFNYIWGVGRFNATHDLVIKNRTYTQFHNVYLDILLSGGIVELVYVGLIYFSVIRKIIKSDLKKVFKRVYIIMYLTFGIYMMTESCGRFSIGSSDTLCMIFFITVPILHANSVKINEKKEDS